MFFQGPGVMRTPPGHLTKDVEEKKNKKTLQLVGVFSIPSGWRTVRAAEQSCHLSVKTELQPVRVVKEPQVFGLACTIVFFRARTPKVWRRSK